MSVPIQLWAPFVTLSPLDPGFARDFKRAQEARHDETRIWIRPHTQPKRWESQASGIRLREALIDGEQLNAFTIYHIDEGRRVFPFLGAPDSPICTLPEGLYRLWMQALPDLILEPPNFTWRIPRVVDDAVVFEHTTIYTQPSPVLPISGIPGEDGRLRAQWPPTGEKLPHPISPETESSEFYGPRRRARIVIGDETADVVLTARDPDMRSTAFWLKWPKPFTEMFPTGGSIDVLHHQAIMRGCIKQLADGKRERAVRTAENWVQGLVGATRSSLSLAWLLPKILADREAALTEVEAKFGVAAANLEELASSSFRERLNDAVEVQRANGWLGYFWYEFYRDLQEGMNLRFCGRCGQLIRGGRSDRGYCSLDENPTCFKQRTASRQQKSRASNATRKRSRHDGNSH